MKKNIKEKAAIFPMPVLLIGTYNEDNTVDVMNAAWGMMLDRDKIVLNLTETHKTVKNIKERGAFTVSLVNQKNLKEADYFGIVSGNNTPNKFEKTNLTTTKSEYVDAPIINEFPVVMECEFIEYQDDEYGCGVIGKIINTQVEEYVLDENGNVDPLKIDTIMYDPFNHGYYSVKEKVGQSFNDGKELK